MHVYVLIQLPFLQFWKQLMYRAAGKLQQRRCKFFLGTLGWKNICRPPSFSPACFLVEAVLAKGIACPLHSAYLSSARQGATCSLGSLQMWFCRTVSPSFFCLSQLDFTQRSQAGLYQIHKKYLSPVLILRLNYDYPALAHWSQLCCLSMEPKVVLWSHSDLFLTLLAFASSCSGKARCALVVCAWQLLMLWTFLIHQWGEAGPDKQTSHIFRLIYFWN